MDLTKLTSNGPSAQGVPMSSFNQNAIKHKTTLLNLAAELGNVSKACKLMGFSRDTFYRYQKAVAEGGVEALFDANRKKPNLKNRVDEDTENAVTAFAIEFPAYGQVRVSNELRKKGVFVSPSGVRSIWLRHGLESMKLRLIALEKKSAEEGIILTEAQVQALERKKAMMKPAAKLKPTIQVISAARILFMSVQSRELAVFISKRMWTHGQNGLPQSFILQRLPSLPLICLMIVCCLSLLKRKWG